MRDIALGYNCEPKLKGRETSADWIIISRRPNQGRIRLLLFFIQRAGYCRRCRTCLEAPYSGNVFLHYCFRAEAKKLCWKGRSRVPTIVVATTPEAGQAQNKEGGVGIIEAVYYCFRIPARTAEGKLCWKCRSRATTIAIGMTPAKEARAARNKKR